MVAGADLEGTMPPLDVNGYPIYGYLSFYGTGSGGYGGGGWDTNTNDHSPDFGTGDTAYPDVSTIDVSEVKLGRPLTAEEQAAVDQLRASMTSMLTGLNSLPAGSYFLMNDGTKVSVDEVIKLLSYTDFQLWPAGTNFGNGGQGMPDWNGGNPIFHIDIAALVTLHAQQGGMAYYLLHELGHITQAGRDRNVAMYDPNSPSGTTMTQAEYLANEQWTNALANMIALVIGAPFLGSPANGYGTFNGTYFPNTSTTGGTGGTSGGTSGGGGSTGGGGPTTGDGSGREAY